MNNLNIFFWNYIRNFIKKLYKILWQEKLNNINRLKNIIEKQASNGF